MSGFSLYSITETSLRLRSCWCLKVGEKTSFYNWNCSFCLSFNKRLIRKTFLLVIKPFPRRRHFTNIIHYKKVVACVIEGWFDEVMFLALP